MINLITDLISFTQPTNLDKESLSVIESIAKIKKVVNECITQFNNLEEKTEEDYKNFLNQITSYKNEVINIINDIKNDNNSFKNEFKEIIKTLENFNISLEIINKQSEYVQDLAKINQDNIDKGTIATQDEINEITKNILNASSFGVSTDSTVDNYNSLNLMFKELGKDISYDTSLSSNRFFNKMINIPPGLYKVKHPNLFKECFEVSTQNLVINGNGASIILEDFEGSLFENNDKVLNMDIYNLNFISINDSKAINRKLISSNSDGGAQAIRFHQCNFNGKLKYGIELTGSNCNSEWVFNQCTFSGEWESFLYIGNTDTSDQFLNYWFNNCKYWCSSNWITAYKGGHFKLNHCDVSGYQPIKDEYLFKLLGGSHSSGVTTFIDDGTRYELKCSQAKVIHCEWDNARVSFENSDFSSNSFNVVERNDIFSFKNDSNGIGSSYIFTNCNLLGKFKLHTSNNAYGCELTLNNCFLDGGAGVSTIQDIFNITYSANVGAVFRVYLNHVKCLNDIYNMVLNSNVGQFNLLNNKATLVQSVYNNLTPDWKYKISQTTIIDEIIYFTKSYQQDGHTYKFSVKSDTSCIVEQTNLYNNKKNIKCSNLSRLYIGNKITIGNSNTVYEIMGMDMNANYMVLNKEVEEGIIVGDKIEFNILDISQKPNGEMKMLKSDNKYIVTNNLYIKNTGEVAINPSGLQGAIVVKTLE